MPNLETTKHHLFDEYWIKYKNYIFGIAIRLARVFGGNKEDYLGTLVIRLNRCLYTFDNIYEFTSYYTGHLWTDIIQNFLCYESESNAIRYSRYKTPLEITFRQINDYDAWPTEIDTQSEWPNCIVNDFKSINHFLAFVNQNLTFLDKFIIDSRFYKGETLAIIGNRLSLTKQRIAQLQNSALCKIKRNLIKFLTSKRYI